MRMNGKLILNRFYLPIEQVNRHQQNTRRLVDLIIEEKEKVIIAW